MAKALKYTQTWFDVKDGTSLPAFEAGKTYPMHDKAALHIARGACEEVDAPDAPVDAEPSGAAAAAETPVATPEPTPAPTAAPAASSKKK